jgi:hypothetical protein
MPEQAQNPIVNIFLTLYTKAQTCQGLAIKPMNVIFIRFQYPQGDMTW